MQDHKVLSSDVWKHINSMCYCSYSIMIVPSCQGWLCSIEDSTCMAEQITTFSSAHASHDIEKENKTCLPALSIAQIPGVTRSTHKKRKTIACCSAPWKGSESTFALVAINYCKTRGVTINAGVWGGRSWLTESYSLVGESFPETTFVGLFKKQN